MGQHWLKPKWSPGLTLPGLPLDHLINIGIEALILDVDRTLLQGRPTQLPNTAKRWVIEAKERMSIHLLSNNPSKTRISKVAKDLGVPYTYAASKPRRKAVIRVIDNLQKEPSSIAIIGDRIFTDILVGNRIGLYTILVLPIQGDGQPSKNQIIYKFESRLARLLGAK